MVTWSALRQSLLHYEKQLTELKKIQFKKAGARLLLRSGARGARYYIKEKNEQAYRYVRKNEFEEVKQIKREHFYKKMIKVLENNICLLQAALEGIVETDYETINALLPKAYQNADVDPLRIKRRKTRGAIPPSENPYLRENLIHKTSFGLMVRSKSELLLAEILYELGVFAENYLDKSCLISSRLCFS